MGQPKRFVKAHKDNKNILAPRPSNTLLKYFKVDCPPGQVKRPARSEENATRDHGEYALSGDDQDNPYWTKPLLLSDADESDDDDFASVMHKSSPSNKKRRSDLMPTSSRCTQTPKVSAQKERGPARSGRPLGQPPSVAQWVSHSADKYSLESLLVEITTNQKKPKYCDFVDAAKLALSDSDDEGKPCTRPEDDGKSGADDDDLDVDPHVDVFGCGPERLPEPKLADLESIDGIAQSILRSCRLSPFKMKLLLKSGWLTPARAIGAGEVMLEWLFSMAAYEREVETAHIASRLLARAITKPEVRGSGSYDASRLCWSFSAEKLRDVLQLYGAAPDLLAEQSQLQGKVMDLTSDDGSVEFHDLPVDNLRCVLEVLIAWVRLAQSHVLDSIQLTSICLLLLKASLDSRVSGQRWEFEIAVLSCLQRLASVGDTEEWIQNARDLAKKIVSFTNGLRAHQLAVLDIIPPYTEECIWFRSRLALSFLIDRQDCHDPYKDCHDPYKDCFAAKFTPYETVTSLFGNGAFKITADTDLRQQTISVGILVYVLYDEGEMKDNLESVKEMVYRMKIFNSSIVDQGPNNLHPTILKDRIQRLYNRLELQISNK